jgi:hypothetical protein
MQNGEAIKLVADVLLNLRPFLSDFDERDAPDIATKFLEAARSRGYALVPLFEMKELREDLEMRARQVAGW